MVPMALLSIGEFARAARMSVKALRHYDALGVLVPAHVDPHSGYRRYERAQLRDALLITLMRQADIGLPVVRSALA
ncbi:MAG: MerR family DNA-binding transcriptional regulator, partial [Rhodococcus sp.]|nr:MerR family DNA-binding transcriptional regulator [Rhodococcus sp. (in: high G+C Gram-positive bacteria)]